jgi:electron transfer flavoprotein alpha subunit
MSVLIFIEHTNGSIKKTAYEALSYGSKLAEMLNQEANGLLLGEVHDDISQLGNFGVKKIHQVKDARLQQPDNQAITQVIADAVAQLKAGIIIFSNSLTAKAVAPRLSVKLKAGMVAGAIALPDLTNGFTVRKNVFSGKAFADVTIHSEIKIITLNANAFTPIVGTILAETIALNVSVPESKIKVTSMQKTEGEISLAEADLVVSGGRGLKGPENWGLVEDLAKLLGAATACSRPVADAHWRPHHEHVGQTGLAIAPNLYIAIGISGAIQHLAGVNRSKVIVVINKDPEAPFFKAADYGIVGDAFEVMPKIIDAVKKMKQ